MTLFKTRIIYHQQKQCAIVLQNRNGPCPIIALINVLSLRGQVSILVHADRDGCITHQVLCNVLAEALLLRIQQQEQMKRVGDKMKEAHERNFNALVAAGSQSASGCSTPNASASKRVVSGGIWGGGSAVSSSRELTVDDPGKATLPPPNELRPTSQRGSRRGSVGVDKHVVSPPTSPAQQRPSSTSSHQPTRSECATLDVLDNIPAMLSNEGAFLNVFFTMGVEGYEFTSVVEFMDACGVRLVHGWLIDPQDTQLMKEVGSDSYNALTGKVAAGISMAEEKERKVASAVDHEMMGDQEEGKVEDPSTYPFFQHFLEQYPTQLTTAGLFALHDSVHEGELCILFRNDHFSVLTKRKHILLTLVTDEDLADKLEASGGNVAWETLEDVNGEASRFAAVEAVPRKRQDTTGRSNQQYATQSGAPMRGAVVGGGGGAVPRHTGDARYAHVQQGVVVSQGTARASQQVRRIDPYNHNPTMTRSQLHNSKEKSGGCVMM